MGKGLSPQSRAGMSDFSAELEAGVGNALLQEPEELTVLLLRQSQAERRGQCTCTRKRKNETTDINTTQLDCEQNILSPHKP